MNVENKMLQHYRTVYKMDEHGLETLSQEELEEIREEVKATCRRAFVDSLTEMMVSDPPAYDWIVKLDQGQTYRSPSRRIGFEKRDRG